MILLLTGNGIAQSVRERIPEFAVLKTLGFGDGVISWLVFLEAAAPCLLGGMLGTALAATISQLPAERLPQGLRGVPTPTMSPGVMAVALCCIILLALVSSALPIFRLRRLSIVDALAGR
jgi:putative ABC transport system permease protein